MNPPEHLIVKIESLDDVTEEYIESKRKKDPYFTIDEKVFNVTLISECCGMLEQKKMIWRESEFIHNLGRGYFLV